MTEVATPMLLSSEDISRFRSLIMAHYHASCRPMPWRETSDPYAILVSEIMLQQTQVERVRSKYAEFMAVFPDVTALAEASLAELLAVWQGLGYNRRALFLKRCCEVVATNFGGVFPCTPVQLQQLPGIGLYTARAVAAFAFGVAEPLIETNIRTVFIHSFCHDRDDVSDRELMPLIAATLDCDNPRDWYYALMDYGAMLKQTLPNPGRRSKHHVRQSRFEGSNRQLRSRLLRYILAQPGMTTAQLELCAAADPEAVRRNLEALQKEGFVVKKGRGFQVLETNKTG
jgi:A/G-specific adenine glycosylase